MVTPFDLQRGAKLVAETANIQHVILDPQQHHLGLRVEISQSNLHWAWRRYAAGN